MPLAQLMCSCVVALQCVALAYACMNKADPLAVAAAVTAAYHATNPLTEEEVDLIWIMIGARNVQSVANSAHSYKLEPDNEYLLISAAPAWKLLRQSDAIAVAAANDALRKACGFGSIGKAASASGSAM